jgi:hypothetical protein
MKQTIRLTESELNYLIRESVKSVIKESEIDIDDDSYYGGGLPEQKPQAHTYTCEKEVTEIYNKIKPYIDQLADIFNDNDFDNREVYDKVIGALNTLDSLPSIGKHFYTIETDEFNDNY